MLKNYGLHVYISCNVEPVRLISLAELIQWISLKLKPSVVEKKNKKLPHTPSGWRTWTCWPWIRLQWCRYLAEVLWKLIQIIFVSTWLRSSHALITWLLFSCSDSSRTIFRVVSTTSDTSSLYGLFNTPNLSRGGWYCKIWNRSNTKEIQDQYQQYLLLLKHATYMCFHVGESSVS